MYTYYIVCARILLTMFIAFLSTEKFSENHGHNGCLWFVLYWTYFMSSDIIKAIINILGEAL